jgi:hypothetical protein
MSQIAFKFAPSSTPNAMPSFVTDLQTSRPDLNVQCLRGCDGGCNKLLVAAETKDNACYRECKACKTPFDLCVGCAMRDVSGRCPRGYGCQSK